MRVVLGEGVVECIEVPAARAEAPRDGSSPQVSAEPEALHHHRDAVTPEPQREWGQRSRGSSGPPIQTVVLGIRRARTSVGNWRAFVSRRTLANRCEPAPAGTGISAKSCSSLVRGLLVLLLARLTRRAISVSPITPGTRLTCPGRSSAYCLISTADYFGQLQLLVVAVSQCSEVRVDAVSNEDQPQSPLLEVCRNRLQSSRFELALQERRESPSSPAAASSKRDSKLPRRRPASQYAEALAAYSSIWPTTSRRYRGCRYCALPPPRSGSCLDRRRWSSFSNSSS